MRCFGKWMVAIAATGLLGSGSMALGQPTRQADYRGPARAEANAVRPASALAYVSDDPVTASEPVTGNQAGQSRNSLRLRRESGQPPVASPRSPQKGKSAGKTSQRGLRRYLQGHHKGTKGAQKGAASKGKGHERGWLRSLAKPCKCSHDREAWTLLSGDNDYGLKAGGWVQFGATTNNRNPVNPPTGSGNLPTGFNYRNDEFQLHQVYGYIEKEADTGGCGWAWGGRVDFVYGDDYIFAQSIGLERHQTGAPHWNGTTGNGISGLARTGVAMPQAYVDIARNDLTLRVGHFYGISGYEQVAAPGNFFYSHSYAMYAKPLTHTGALAIWTPSEQWTFQAGAVNGWDKTDALTDRTAFLGGVTWKSCDGQTTIAATFISGNEDGTTGNITENRSLYSIVLDQKIGDRWEYVLEHLYGWDNKRVGANQEWYGVNQYLFYTLNDCWKVGTRFEWFRDDDGGRFLYASSGNYYQATLGLNWSPRPNIQFRPEVRYDWFDGTSRPNTGGPFANFTKTNQFTAAMDVIFTF